MTTVCARTIGCERPYGHAGDCQAQRRTTIEHPARWSAAVLVELCEFVEAEAEQREERLRVLDPFAGVGRARLAETLPATAVINVTGVELQPEWAAADPDGLTYTDDALDLPFQADTFDAIVTSPCYGNRMADSHDAKDACGACQGTGVSPAAYVVGGGDRPCPACKGHGLSRRNTYAHALQRAGAQLADGSAAAMQWGAAYRTFHSQAIGEWRRVLKPAGLALVNMSNHVRGGVEQPVVEWWLREFFAQGWRLVEARPVATPRQRHGANGDLRAAREFILAVRAPETGGML